MPENVIDRDRRASAPARPGAPGPGLLRTIAHRLRREDAALPVEGRLPGFDGATGWLNGAPVPAADLRGRVVLVQFWTYTCINWLRTLPYVRAWDARYGARGLTVIGVHSPEFGFERTVRNIEAAVRSEDVPYRVAIDSDFAIWRAFANRYWPALYLADAEGRVRFHHFGEGEYVMTELAIQQLLLEAGAEDIDPELVAVEPRGLELPADWTTLGSPETYLGHSRSTGFASPDSLRFNVPHRYPQAARLGRNEWAPTGTWTIAGHAAVLDEPGGRLAFRFLARDVHLVMGPASLGTSIRYQVRLDGSPAGEDHGDDVGHDGYGLLADQRLHQLVRQAGPVRERLLEIEFLDAGVEAYCFTFG